MGALGVHWARLDFGANVLDPQRQLAWTRGRARTWGIRDRKFKSNRKLPLYSGLVHVFGPARQAEGLLFRDPRGDAWNETGPAQELLRNAYTAAGIRREGVLWHALRHTYASLLAAGGIRHHEIELLMGHKVPGTTGLSLHVTRETFEKVEVILDQAFGAALDRRLGTTERPVRERAKDLRF